MSNLQMQQRTLTKSFISEDFLLRSDAAKILYHDYAKEMPIVDYHCHLPQDLIASDYVFRDLTEIWLKGDHYKWRALRALGVNEKYITGDASSKEKFDQWASVVPHTMRNPLYHWTHMELKNPFGIDVLLNEKSADYVYHTANELLPSLSTRTILNKFKVKVVGTTDDPCDNLADHQKIHHENIGVRVVPTFRPDQLMNIDQPEVFKSYLDRLRSVSGYDINSWDSLIKAIQKRHDHFDSHGCRTSDHGQTYLYAEDYTESEVKSIFNKSLLGIALTIEEANQYKAAIQYELAVMDWQSGWVQQFHLGAIRNNNTRLLTTLGRDIGVDSIGDYPQIEAMSAFFDRLDKDNKLAKTIVYNLNPGHNASFATMMGNFQDGTIRGKMQFGSGWWFLDQKDGMTDQINTLSNMGILSTFVGMITDSRSFLSFPRHDYFRRILCNLLGNDIVNGEIPGDIPFLGKMVQDICFNNAKEYFGW